jgi:hypothetical protein
MINTVGYYSAIAALLLAASPAHVGPCSPGKTESLNAQRGYQPTPRSIAATEKVDGPQFGEWLLIHSTAPAQPTAQDTSPSAAGKSPMRELCCVTSGVVSIPPIVISFIVQSDSRTCVLKIPVLPRLSIIRREKCIRA